MDDAPLPRKAGDYCFVRHQHFTAPLVTGTRLLFVGHTPPPDDQWHAASSGGRNSTVQALRHLIGSDHFSVRAKELGIWSSSHQNTKMFLYNAVPIVSGQSRCVGDPLSKRGILQYHDDETAIALNDRVLEVLIKVAQPHAVILGPGKPKPEQCRYVCRTVRTLRRLAEDKTFLFCSVGADLPPSDWRKKYAGHPRPGHGRENGIAAQPLKEFARYHLTPNGR